MKKRRYLYLSNRWLSVTKGQARSERELKQKFQSSKKKHKHATSLCMNTSNITNNNQQCTVINNIKKSTAISHIPTFWGLSDFVSPKRLVPMTRLRRARPWLASTRKKGESGCSMIFPLCHFIWQYSPMVVPWYPTFTERAARAFRWEKCWRGCGMICRYRSPDLGSGIEMWPGCLLIEFKVG